MSRLDFTKTWTSLKALITSKWLSLQYDDRGTHYYIYLVEDSVVYSTEIFKAGNEPEGIDVDQNTADRADFETNYKATANAPLVATDIDGAVVLRPKAAKKGWTYALIPMEATTSTVGDVDSKLVDGTNRAGVSIKIYDSNGAEITDPANEGDAVKTVLSFEPPYDYEIIGGQLQQIEKPVTDIHVWVIAVPDVPANYGGSKEMIGGVDLKYIDPTDKLQADGRASKLMVYNATYHTNKLHAVLKHDAGVKHSFMMCIELFRA